MRIDAKINELEPSHISLSVSGAGGDKKQPVRYAYFSLDISRSAAKKLAAEILKLLNGGSKQ